MALIPWKEEYRTGIDAVDHEHREMISTINRMIEQLRQDASPDEILDILGEIHSGIEAHFALEEKVMRDRKYRGYAEHKAEHNRLLEEIRDIMEDINDRARLDSIKEKLSHDIDAWFREHFLHMDLKYHQTVRGDDHDA